MNNNYAFAKAFRTLTASEVDIIEALMSRKFKGSIKELATKMNQHFTTTTKSIVDLENKGIVEVKRISGPHRGVATEIKLAKHWDDALVYGAEYTVPKCKANDRIVESSANSMYNYTRKTYDMWATERKLNGRWIHVNYYVTQAEAEMFANPGDRVRLRRVRKESAQ